MPPPQHSSYHNVYISPQALMNTQMQSTSPTTIKSPITNHESISNDLELKWFKVIGIDMDSNVYKLDTSFHCDPVLYSLRLTI